MPLRVRVSPASHCHVPLLLLAAVLGSLAVVGRVVAYRQVRRRRVKVAAAAGGGGRGEGREWNLVRRVVNSGVNQRLLSGVELGQKQYDVGLEISKIYI